MPHILARILHLFLCVQSSFYFQAVAAQTSLKRNVVFNIPRAAINFNDGFGGGNVLR